MIRDDDFCAHPNESNKVPTSNCSRPQDHSKQKQYDLLDRYQSHGYEALNDLYIEYATTIDDLRSEMWRYLDALLPKVDLAELVAIYEWLELAGESLKRFPALVVLRAACLDILYRYATRQPKSSTRTPLAGMLNPTNVDLMPPSYIQGALIALPIPKLGRAHGLQRRTGAKQ